MRKREIQYRAAVHLVECVKLLKLLGEQGDFINTLLDKAQDLKDSIDVDEEETRKIGEYKDKIRD